jgi:hypothetical protein
MAGETGFGGAAQEIAAETMFGKGGEGGFEHLTTRVSETQHLTLGAAEEAGGGEVEGFQRGSFELAVL